MADLRTSNLAEYICDRKCACTPRGTLPEIIAYLSGFDYALQLSSGRDGSDRGSPKQLLDWLTTEFGKPGTAPCFTCLDGLLERYLTEDAAIESMQDFASRLPDGVDKAISNRADD